MMSHSLPPEVTTPSKGGANGRDDDDAGGARGYGGGPQCAEEVARNQQDCKEEMQTPSV